MIKILQQEINQFINAKSQELRELSLQIHSNPEIGWNEHFAHKILTEYLQKDGWIVEKHAFGLETAFLASFTQLESSPSIALCAEYDALPMGHACGHNLISIQALATGMALKHVLSIHDIPGQVCIYGTPAEEVEGGKINILKAGGFKNDVAFMLHPGNIDVYAPRYLALQCVNVAYHGKAAHGSVPFDGINALDALVQAYQSIAMLRQHMPMTSRVHGIFTKAGEAPNVIPAETAGKFYIRSRLFKENVKLVSRVEHIFNASALSTGCTVDIEKEEPFMDVVNNDILADRWGEYMTSLGVEFLPKHMQEQIPRGSTDMGNVSHHIPSFHNLVNVYSSTDEEKAEIHTIGFREQAKTQIAHDNMMRGATCQAWVALDCLLDLDFLRDAKTRHLV
jgi:amidohydrolase